MHTAGVIAEYNPLHGGHIEQLKRIKEETGADRIIVAMSGDFVQRGEPAVYDMASRTRMALLAGADLVLEIPVIFSTASAPDFAAASVALLDKLGVVDDLCFGSECGDIDTLQSAAAILYEEPDIFKAALQDHLKKGESYPRAQAAALNEALRDGGSEAGLSSLDVLFSSPNNILGIEYIRSLMARGSNIRPLTLKREGQAYNDTAPDHLNLNSAAGSKDHPSASAIRSAIKEGIFEYSDYLDRILPGSGCESLKYPLFSDDLSELLNEKILDVCSDLQKDEAVKKLSAYSDLSSELASSIYREALSFNTFSKRISRIKSKAYTYSRISRAFLHLLLGITDEAVERAKSDDYISYIRVLGFKRSAEGLLGEIHKRSALPLITKTAGTADILSAGGKFSFLRDLYASHLYQSLVFDKYGIRPENEFTRPLIII